MAKVVKVIELLSESPKSWEDAAQTAVREASKTLRNIRSIYIKEFTAAADNGKSPVIGSTRKSLSTSRLSEVSRGGKRVETVSGLLWQKAILAVGHPPN